MKCEVYNRPDGIVLDIIETQETPIIAARRAKVYGVANSFETSDSGEQLPADAGTHHQISLMAIASYSELLGNGTNYNKTVKEIMFIREHGEPDPDPVTAANAWTPAYEELDADVNNVPMTMTLSDEPVGIAKTRSMLGLPAIGQEVSPMSLEADPAGIASYSIDDNVSGKIASYTEEIEKYREQFRKDLKWPTDEDMKQHKDLNFRSNEVTSEAPKEIDE